MSSERPYPTPPSRRASYAPVSANSPSASPAPLPHSTTDPYANLSGAALSPSAYAALSPENPETSQLLGRDSMYMPAPSLMSRNSSIPGTPPLGGDHRASWGSGMALGAGAAAIAGTPNQRGQSRLAATPTSRASVSDADDDEYNQGHVAPSAAVGGAGAGMSEKAWAGEGSGKSRKKLWIGLGVAGVLLLAGLGVGLGVGLTQSNRNKAASSNASGSGSGSGSGSSSRPSGTASGASASSPSASAGPTSGVQGSILTLEDGSTMTYNNPHGGKWVWDPSNPFNNEAQAQSWTPALNANWTWGKDKIYGVNVGGWLDTEPFIVPGLYEKYATGSNGQTAVDEFTLNQNMGSARNSIMDNHYATFITERDFAEMVAAGINWIRLPFGHWAIETIAGEAYYERKSWEYVLLAIKWARKYGIRINLDLHTMPGSQNGWNHSGKLGGINWMNGVMGLANAQRGLEYIRTVTQFIVQPEYAPVVQLWGFINEPNANALGQQRVGTFYRRAYDEIRSITGIGAGNGPMLSIHDGFIGIQSWYGFMNGADRLALDQHPYLIFGDQQTGTLDEIASIACQIWSGQTNTTLQQYGEVVAGEWSAAINDCGQWVNRVGGGSRYDGTFTDGYTGPGGGPGSCAKWNDYRLWDQATKDGLRSVVLAEMDALGDYFFWTWKIGNSTGSIPEPNPFWHYRLGLREGWIPSDPRVAAGECARRGFTDNPWSGTFSRAAVTGGAGAGQVAAAMTQSYPWPPSSFASSASTQIPAAQMTLLPQYTQSGAPITMPAMTFTKPGDAGATIAAGDGWANDAQNRQRYVAVSGCSYPPEYSAENLQPTAGMCGAGARAPSPRTAMPETTAPPS